jgi:prepilin signal peptidase PulO-like enzyme (type II secretory pathway)
MAEVGTVIAFIFGLLFGSFLNVVIYRYDDWLSIVKDRSACPRCKQRLGWYDLIPLLSFITLLGKCRYCREPISWQYPAVELSTALLIASFYNRIFGSGDLALPLGIIAFLGAIISVGAIMVIFFHDLYEQMVPDLMAYLLLIGALMFSITYYRSLPVTGLGLIVGGVPIALIVYLSQGKWMGEGDVKIAAALGGLVGYPSAIVFLAATFLLGGIFGLLAVSLKKAKLTTAIPFVPFMVVGALIAFFWGEPIMAWYLGLIGVPIYGTGWV